MSVDTDANHERLQREGYDAPVRQSVIATAAARAERADWLVLPPLGWSIAADGTAHEITPGAMTGERTVWHYVQHGPYLPIPEELLREVREEAHREAVAAVLTKVRSHLGDLADILGVELGVES